jgi:hypothetical protein
LCENIYYDKKKIATGFVYTPYYEPHSSESSCFASITHFALADTNISIIRDSRKKTDYTYSVGQAGLDFLTALGLVSGWTDEKGNMREIVSKEYFRDKRVMLLVLEEKAHRVTFGHTDGSWHTIWLLMNKPQISKDYEIISGKLGIEFTPELSLGGHISDNREDNDYDLRLSQAGNLMKSMPVEADEILVSKIQEANQIFADMLDKIRGYWGQKGVKVAASRMPVVTYDRMVPLMHDWEN